MSYEQEPNYSFPWQSNGTYEYLTFRNGEHIFQIHPFNTIMYLFPDEPEMDHIFVMREEKEETYEGYFIWRRNIDEAIGDGAFRALCDDLFDHDFDLADDETPSDMDYDNYASMFGRSPREQSIEKIVALALENFDAKADYYLNEWS